MTRILSHPVTLIVGVPLIFIALVSSIGLVSTAMVNPQYGFLYAVNDRMTNVRENFYVEDGALKAHIDPELAEDADADDIIGKRRISGARSTRFYVYDTEAWTSRPISYAEAQMLTLDASRTAPDGYSVERSRSSGMFFPFFWNDSSRSESVISKGSLSRRLPLDEYYQDSFIGWIIE